METHSQCSFFTWRSLLHVVFVRFTFCCCCRHCYVFIFIAAWREGSVWGGEGWFCPPGNIWRHLKTFLVVTTWGRGGQRVLLAFSGRGQGCHETSSNAQESTRDKLILPQVPVAPRLRNPDLWYLLVGVWVCYEYDCRECWVICPFLNPHAFPLSKRLGLEFLSHRLCLCSALAESASVSVVPIRTSTSSAWAPRLFYFCTNVCISCIFLIYVFILLLHPPLMQLMAH